MASIDVEKLYAEQIKSLPATERLRLLAVIARDLAPEAEENAQHHGTRRLGRRNVAGRGRSKLRQRASQRVGSSLVMTLDDALANVSALGLDTAPFIYFVERNPSYINLVREVFARVDSGALVGYCSTITLTEVLTLPKRTQNQKLESEYGALRRT